MVGEGQDGEQVVVYLRQAQPSQRCGDDGLSKTGVDGVGGGGGLSHLCDQFCVGFAAPGIISGRHCRLRGLRTVLVNSSASTSLAVRISYQSQDLWA